MSSIYQPQGADRLTSRRLREQMNVQLGVVRILVGLAFVVGKEGFPKFRREDSGGCPVSC
jgi:hypothetical protein